jgi:hypothetical protein
MYSVRLAVFAVTLMLLYHGLHDIHPFTHAFLHAEVSSPVGFGKPRAPASTRCPETKRQKAPFDKSGSNPLGYPVAILGRLAKAVDRGPTRDRRPLAQARVPSLLEMEEPTAVAGTAEDSQGGS